MRRSAETWSTTSGPSQASAPLPGPKPWPGRSTSSTTTGTATIAKTARVTTERRYGDRDAEHRAGFLPACPLDGWAGAVPCPVVPEQPAAGRARGGGSGDGPPFAVDWRHQGLPITPTRSASRRAGHRRGWPATARRSRPPMRVRGLREPASWAYTAPSAPVAQGIERWVADPKAAGSNPARRTTPSISRATTPDRVGLVPARFVPGVSHVRTRVRQTVT